MGLIEYILRFGIQKSFSFGEFPHMAAIGWKTSDEYEFRCGGSLISERFEFFVFVFDRLLFIENVSIDGRFVMTAAHCTKYDR